MKIEINKLMENPLNKKTYGTEDNTALLEKVKRSGWIKPIIVNPDFIILSGHRRLEVARTLGHTEIECEIFTGDPVRQLEIFLLENQYRVKTTLQKIKEGQLFLELEKQRAHARMVTTGNVNLGLESAMEPSPTLEPKGTTRDIVGERIGMSGRSFERGTKVADRIEAENNEIFKWFFQDLLDNNITTAEKLVKKPDSFIERVIEKSEGDVTKVSGIIKDLELKEHQKDFILPPGKYQVVYIDLTNTVIGKPEFISFSNICEPDCILFLWVLPSQLEIGLDCCKQWGFQYKTCLAWHKDSSTEVSENIELLLVATKGNPPMIFQKYSVGGEKPSAIIERVKQGYDGSITELFIGNTIEGWEIW